jgi:hypothetical protein
METPLTQKSASLTALGKAGEALEQTGNTPIRSSTTSTNHTSDAELNATLARRRKAIAPTLRYLEEK